MGLVQVVRKSHSVMFVCECGTVVGYLYKGSFNYIPKSQRYARDKYPRMFSDNNPHSFCQSCGKDCIYPPVILNGKTYEWDAIEGIGRVSKGVYRTDRRTVKARKTT